jgi:hypothetical protein
VDTTKFLVSIGILLAIAGFVPWLLDQRGVHTPPSLILWCGLMAIVTSAACLYYPFYPNLIAAVAIAFGTGLIVAWWWIGPTNSVTPSVKVEEPMHDVSLFLQFSDGHTVPKEVRQTNILSWYALYTESIYVDAKDKKNKSVGGISVPPRWSVFVLFKQQVKYRQMLATCSGSESLKCAVAFSNDRYAILTAVGDVSRSTLEVSVIP